MDGSGEYVSNDGKGGTGIGMAVADCYGMGDIGDCVSLVGKGGMTIMQFGKGGSHGGGMDEKGIDMNSEDHNGMDGSGALVAEDGKGGIGIGLDGMDCEGADDSENCVAIVGKGGTEIGEREGSRAWAAWMPMAWMPMA